MSARLLHRGPDGDGFHVEEARGLGMAHQRLSIIDLDTGAQPLRLDEPPLVLTANGELYDYKPIRTDLSCRGARFKTRSDSEIALHLYARHGLEFVDHLRGEFALALFDEERQRLVLVRDRFGIKPLYFHLRDDAIVWGSEVKAVLAHPRVPARLDARAALHQMMQVMVPGTTAFEGIRTLRPGHMLVVELEGGRLRTEEKCYWDMRYPAASEGRTMSAREAVEGVRERLIDAVRVRLEADVPVGCYLSGGIDSCSMLGLATQMQQSPVKAFTISFDHAAYDEAAIAREMAATTHADHELLELSAADLYGESFEKTLWHTERTFYNTLGVAKWHMSKRVRECGFKVVITGEGADEMFSGYPFFKRDHFLHGAADSGENLASQREQLEASNALFKGAILSEQEMKHPAFEDLCGFTPSWIQPWMMTLAEVRPLLSERLREELEGYDPVAAIAEQIPSAEVRSWHPLDRSQYTWIKTMLEGQILTWGGDRVDMANSMESRPAFLDHHLAEFAARVPPEHRIREGVEKWVLREAMRGVLPTALYEREKFAFMAPPSHVDEHKQAAVDDLIGRHLSAEVVETAGLLDAKAASAFLDGRKSEKDLARKTRMDIVLNHMLGLQLLDRHFVREPSLERSA